MSYRTAIVSTGLLLLASCSRHTAPPAIERLAILRFENLGSDSSNDWMGRAFAEVITRELTGAAGISTIPASRLAGINQSLGARPVAAPGISTERTAALSIGANRLGYGSYAVVGDKLEARLTIEDPAGGRMVKMLSATTAPTGLIDAATLLARQVSNNARPYPPVSARALEQYARALEASDLASATRLLEGALAADPDFTPAYRGLAELKARQQDRDGAIRLLGSALEHGSRLDAAERAQIEGELAMLRGDSAQQEQAAATLAKSDPHDPAAWKALAETAFNRHNYRQAAEAYAKLVELEPADVTAWNQYGYAAAYAGDLKTAVSALERYRSLRPNEANPLDSLGDVRLVHGRLKEAEDLYLQAARKDPNFLNGADLFKAAMARLMTGDVSGADALAQQYVEARRSANDPLAPYHAAEWDWLAGRRKQAYRQMETLARAAGARDLAVRGYTQLAVWSLMMGDREAAATMAQQALPLATGAATLPAFLAHFLAQPQASAEVWKQRAERAFQNVPAGPIRDVPMVFALLLHKEFPAAAALLAKLESSGTNMNETDLRILQAWPMVETGDTAGAAPLLRWNPIPPATGPGTYISFHFPRFYYLRGVVAEKEGHTEEARNNYRLFVQLSGPDPLMWGEEKKARDKLQ